MLRTFYRSRYEYPTRLITNGTKGHLQIGHVAARKSIEAELGRSLGPETQIDKRAGNWRFREYSPPAIPAKVAA